MKYFFSSSASHYLELQEMGAENFLLSYAVDAKHAYKMIDEDSVIIDSGAFSVWTKGDTIDIEDYLKFCMSLPDKWQYVNLDVIPKTGSTPDEIELCCEEGYKNYLYLKKHLKNVMPVYHYGDHIKWLHKFMQESDYIGISPANDTSEKVKRQFFKEVFNVVQDKVKTHALGYSSDVGVTLFPFYSVDTISYKYLRNLRGNDYLVSKQLYFFFRRNIKKYLKLERDVKKLWKSRGIIW